MYPPTTIRTRIQQNQFIYSAKDEKYKGIADIVKKIVKNEGVKGFYKGFMPNILKGIPSKGIYFYFYELIKLKVFHIPHHKF